ncbi:MAG: Crp/Fnr family transcriptional regulator [Muribaculaceae bacterium]|nr:Crp/Fnr family transcriptional regulator [Muribaculaceae bacterium]HUN20629.1 Crp/Fnr family transcriptional regulator [Muribaculaceae bacterium]
MAQFNKYDSLIDLSAIKDYCRENGRLCRYAKEETFVQQGTVGKYLGVVESGYFKYTTITSSGNDAVVGFAFEGTIVADYYNSFNGLPSETTIKAGIDCSVSQIRIAEARNIFNSVFDGNLSKINGVLFSEIYSRYLELYRKTPTERYLDMISLYPQILDIVSLKDIASYLLITPIYLSRIRKNLAKKNGE